MTLKCCYIFPTAQCKYTFFPSLLEDQKVMDTMKLNSYHVAAIIFFKQSFKNKSLTLVKTVLLQSHKDWVLKY